MRKNKWMLATDVTISAQTSHQFRAESEQVWVRIASPELPMLLDPAISMAGRLPGTPHGVGEIQYAVLNSDDGKLLMANEIVEYEHGRRARTRSMTDGWEPVWVETTLKPLGEGRVRLSHEWTMTCPKGMSVELAELCRLRLERTANQAGEQLRRLFA